MGLGFSPAEPTILHPKCPARAVSHSTGHRGDFFSPLQTAFICQNIQGRWKLLNSGQQIASDKVLSILALKSLFSKIQITKSFFSVLFFFFLLSLLTSFFLLSEKREGS